MAKAFELGDIVQLKSGGPPMTISEQGGRGGFWCEWFRGASKERAHFSEHTLQTYVAPKKDD